VMLHLTASSGGYRREWRFCGIHLNHAGHLESEYC
jgi:hypothetical protein